MLNKLLVFRLVAAVFCATALLALSLGCAAKTEDDSTIPWSRPASWEGQMPGFGG